MNRRDGRPRTAATETPEGGDAGAAMYGRDGDGDAPAIDGGR